MKKQIFLGLVMSSLMLSGCTAVGVATGAGAATGIAAAKEGGIKQSFKDAQIAATINDYWFKYDLETFTKLNLDVNQGRVLVTGVVQNPQHRVEAIRLVWKVSGVTQVINEIQIAESEGITGLVKDNWITTRIRTSITLDRDVQSLNYSIVTVQGSVYLMGVSQDQGELNRVIEIARTIPGVRQVVSYVKMAGAEVVEQNAAPSNDLLVQDVSAPVAVEAVPIEAPAQ